MFAHHSQKKAKGRFKNLAQFQFTVALTSYKQKQPLSWEQLVFAMIRCACSLTLACSPRVLYLDRKGEQ